MDRKDFKSLLENFRWCETTFAGQTVPSRFTEQEVSMLNQLFEDTADGHGTQKYGEFPYSYHLYNVVENVLELFIDLANSYSYINMRLLKACVELAILHDYREDVKSVIDFYILSSLQNDTLDLLTHDKELMSYDVYIHNLINSGNFLALVVKTADMYTNYRHSLRENSDKRCKKYSRYHNKLMIAVVRAYPNTCIEFICDEVQNG